MSGEPTGHDWFHVERVVNAALVIQQREGGNRYLVHMAALLHDLFDHKFYEGDESAALDEFLTERGELHENICELKKIIGGISFKGGKTLQKNLSLETQIVQDADRLDAIGAIGIARAFAYGGNKKRMIYHPEIAPLLNQDYETYKKREGTTLNHFYEKLLLLYDRLNTETAKKIALKRHEHLQKFVDQFHAEWNGEDLSD